ncbi:MAG: tRNA preQ1(34) S-adenosylmethionine ribosyltransferase-isomerase QueA [Gemmatimonadota bacterium]|jgi:S-adenosylmethionine:tRNA ribosyltransferase-isomerase|nr:tRNA preQ1(34) S-adenosylmethionine ribosyltransferase-isomerase QueA [Gemmatimonadota bacterium]
MTSTPGRLTSDYSFDLPPDQIASAPAEHREQSRLLVMDRGSSGELRHRRFADVVDLVSPGDVMVVNETRVFPARLRGVRAGGGAAEVLLLHADPADPAVWTALVRPGAKLKPGRMVEIGEELGVEVLDSTPGGERIVRLVTRLPLMAAIEKNGEVPLPPYIRRAPTDEDRERYQTVYARESGSIAAPTAGLHFTPELLNRLTERGVSFAPVVLHVGVGTFRPVEVEDPAEHQMHSEWYRVPESSATLINAARSAGASVWAVGTTSVRTLESVASEDGQVSAGEGWTEIFIRPPYSFRAVDRLITNFHLPRSTLLMLVAAFAGYEGVMRAYGEAVRQDYRFYSYGDAMAVI